MTSLPIPTAARGGLFLISNNWNSYSLQSVSIDHVTGFGDPIRPALLIGDRAGLPKISGLTFTNSILIAGQYPVWSTGGSDNCAIHDIPLTTFNTCFSSYTFSHNALIGTPASYPVSKWPSGNFFPANPQAVQFVAYDGANGGDYRLLSSSKYLGAGTDGKNLGADIETINTITAGVAP